MESPQEMSPDDELLHSRRHERFDVPIEMVWRCQSAGAAVSLAVQASGLSDKEIYCDLGIDAAAWSRIKSDQANLPAACLERFCALVGNIVYVQWLCHQVGYFPVMTKSEAERRAELAERKVGDLEQEVRTLTKLLHGRAMA